MYQLVRKPTHLPDFPNNWEVRLQGQQNLVEVYIEFMRIVHNFQFNREVNFNYIAHFMRTNQCELVNFIYKIQMGYPVGFLPPYEG
jgi:hypothetical protein